MKHASDLRHRRFIRLRDYDYSQAGAYFVTICAKDRACLFGDVLNGEMRLNDAGRMVADVWITLPTRFPSIDIDEIVVMPNHFHAVVVFTDCDTVPERDVGAPLVGAPCTLVGALAQRAGTRPAPTDGTRTKLTLGDVVGAFKSMTTDQYVVGVKQNDWSAFPGKLWQRNYYEHIIRDDDELSRIRRYIIDNPAQWIFDREHPVNAVTETGVGAQFIAPSKETWLR
ncbi:MAG: hypothetical protein MUC50_10715 [Myxococcota bacterium]|jgi:REP element-mobilizing transposase RayT|nr:hypothetical protein [Myxococcota bacterium]